MSRPADGFRLMPAAGPMQALALALLLLAPGLATAGPASPLLPDFAFADAPLAISGDLLPWMSPRDARYNDDFPVAWNNHQRPGRGAVALRTTFMSYYADEEDDLDYVENARVLEYSQTAVFAGVVAPGVTLAAEVGVRAIQLRPDGDNGYDRFQPGYYFGASVVGELPLMPFFALGTRVGIWNWENRLGEDANPEVVDNGGDELVIRAYFFRADIYARLELLGDPDTINFSVIGGAGYHIYSGRLYGANRYEYRPPRSDEITVFGGVELGIGEVFSVSGDVRFIGVFSAQLSLQALF